MSEFSESYHLRTGQPQDAVRLLNQAKLVGFVYPQTNGWVTFVAENGVFQPDQRIVAAANHPLLHYASAEDHGWSFALFSAGKPVSSYESEWSQEITWDDSRYSRAAIEAHVSNLDRALLDEFERKMRPESFDDLFEWEPSKLFARAIQLEHYEWLSFLYVGEGRSHSPDQYKDVIVVA